MASISVAIARDTLLSIGDTVLVTAVAKAADGSVISTAPITWSTSSSATASFASTIGASANAVAVANGNTTITAKSGTVQGSAVLTVRQRVSRIVVSPTTVTLGLGQTSQVSANIVDARNHAVSGAAAPAYKSSDANTATVSSSGLVTGVAAGTATITATQTSADGTVTASVAVTVNGASFPSTAEVFVDDSGFSPGTIDLAAGGTVHWSFGGTLAHNVTSSDNGPLHGPTQSTGTFAFTFQTPGRFAYLCTIHPFMTGTIVVH